MKATDKVSIELTGLQLAKIYAIYEEEWLQALFAPKKSKEQIQLEAVMNQIAELQQQANVLKEIIENK